MKGQVKKIGYAGMLVLLCVWWMGHAEGGGGDGKSLVGRLKSIYLSLKAHMIRLEQRMGGVEKQLVDVKEVSKRSKTQAGLAEAEAKDARAKARTAEQKVGELQGSVQRLQKQLAQQTQAFQAYRRLFAKEEAAHIARIKEEAEALKRKAGEQRLFKVGGVEFKARWIPAGKFMMGSPDSDIEVQSDEKPQREVEITRGFWMMETEVTQAQYRAVMGENPSEHASCGDNCPVENVRWHEAALFANKLSEARQQPKCFVCVGARDKAYCDAWGNQGSDYIGCKGWRLPTEAEWEYAARAGTSTPRYGAADRVGWYRGNSGGKTQPVGQKQPNAWRLYDMLGNVWEWVYDGWDSNAYMKLGNVDPVVTAASSRVERGGCWYLDAGFLRAAYRSNNVPAKHYSNLGFRLVRR